jgi:hypothetical protein
MKTCRFLCLILTFAAAACLVACDGKPSPPDSTSAGMQETTAPTGRENFGQSSGQGVHPQNLGTSPTPEQKK